jgi:hypothetical protein
MSSGRADKGKRVRRRVWMVTPVVVVSRMRIIRPMVIVRRWRWHKIFRFLRNDLGWLVLFLLLVSGFDVHTFDFIINRL